MSGMSVIEGICLVGQKAKGKACQYFKIMKEDVDLGLHAWVIVESIAVKVAELRVVVFVGGTSE